MPSCTCGKGATKFCSRCKSVSYCSKECQVKDWKDHKLVCKQQRVLPKIASFDEGGYEIIAKGELDEVAVWVSTRKDEIIKERLIFQVITQNFGKGAALATPDTAHLILHSSKRIKVSKEDSKIIAINGTSADPTIRKISLQTQEHAWMQVAFALDDFASKSYKEAILELSKFVLPVKVDGRGMINVEATVDAEAIKKLFNDIPKS